MKTSAKFALASTGLAVAGVLFLVGTSYADRGFGPHRMMMGGVGKEMLKTVDTNDDGALSQEEIDAAIEARFALYDADKSGDLTLEEFQGLWAEVTRPVAVRAFQFLDPNGDAVIAENELDAMFGNIVVTFDRNDDGKLSPADRRFNRLNWRKMREHGPRHGWGDHAWRGDKDEERVQSD